MAEVNPRSLVSVEFESSAPSTLHYDFTVNEITLTESLMSPTLQTRILVQSSKYPGYVRNLDDWKGTTVSLRVNRPLLEDFGYESELYLENTVISVSERKPLSIALDQYIITAADSTSLLNASKRVSKSWKCTPPHAIVGDVLSSCVGAPNIVLEACEPNRTFFAENLYPYQIVAQQADVALAGQNDPSFLHYMTYENITGTHRFESLYGMTRKSPVFSFEQVERGQIDVTWANPNAILKYEFPCDFDSLSDVLNGYDQNGVDQNALLLINPFNGIHSIIGGTNAGCGMGGQATDTAFTNKVSAAAEGNCEIDVEKHKLKRTARLGLLDRDKVAMRLTVGFNPALHAGKMINAQFHNKQDINGQLSVEPDYGTGTYLISGVTHHLKTGGYCTTVIDCISESVGQGGQT